MDCSRGTSARTQISSAAHCYDTGHKRAEFDKMAGKDMRAGNSRAAPTHRGLGGDDDIRIVERHYRDPSAAEDLRQYHEIGKWEYETDPTDATSQRKSE
jgi:hypothetical protein